MADTAIVRIPVDDAAFKRFLATWDAYQEQLKGQGKAWAEGTAQMRKFGDGASEAFSSTAEGLAAVAVALAAVARREADSEMSTRRSNNVLRDTLKLTGGILSNVTGVALQLTRWALLGGLTGFATGMLGASALASQASGLRSESRGLGVTPGQLQAADVVFGPLGIGGSGLLNAIARMQLTDPAHAALLGITNANPADVLPNLLARGVAQFNATPVQGRASLMEQMGFGFLDQLGWANLAGLKPKEFQERMGMFRSESQRLNMPDSTLKAWQNLDQTIADSEKTIRNAFITALAPLAPNLAELSRTIADSIKELSQSGKLKEWIKDLGEGIHDFVKYLTSDEFKTDIQSFRGVVHALGHPLESALKADAGIFSNLPVLPFGVTPGALGQFAGQSAADVADLYGAAMEWSRNNMSVYGIAQQQRRAMMSFAPGSLPAMSVVPSADASPWYRQGAAQYNPAGQSVRSMLNAPTTVNINISNKPGTDVTSQIIQTPTN